MVRQLPTPFWSYQETIQRLKEIQDPYRQHMCSMYYATGARLNELMPLTPSQISPDNAHPGIYWVSIYTLKQRTRKSFRTIPITWNEPRLLNVVKEFHQSGATNYRQFVLDPAERTIRRWVRKSFDPPIKVHHLRHLRAHHLGKTQVPGQAQMTVKELQLYFGWKDIKTPNYYLENATPQEVLIKMLGGKNY